MRFDELSAHLATLMDAVESRLEPVTDKQWAHAASPGKWTRIEIVGHLVDSACNNHQRFVRALAAPSLEWPGYDQEAHVRVQHFAQEDPRLVVGLFLAFNRHLAWLFGQFPPDKLASLCTIGGAPAMSLGDLALDYVAHLEHHLRQILDGLDAAPATAICFSGMPWPPADPNRQWPA